MRISFSTILGNLSPLITMTNRRDQSGDTRAISQSAGRPALIANIFAVSFFDHLACRVLAPSRCEPRSRHHGCYRRVCGPKVAQAVVDHRAEAAAGNEITLRRPDSPRLTVSAPGWPFGFSSRGRLNVLRSRPILAAWARSRHRRRRPAVCEVSPYPARRGRAAPEDKTGEIEPTPIH
jgi:hypothetical protein